METRANYIAVGFFTLITFVAAFALTYWFGRYGDNQNLVDINVRIQGSVSGLGKGSLVQFNGITVGRVTGLNFDRTDPRFVIVSAEVDAETPIRSDTRANIGIRGLSGGAFIQLEGGTPAAPSLINGPQNLNSIPQIEGDPAALTDLLTRINGIAAQTERVMTTLERFTKQNDQTVSRTLTNVEQFSQALAKNSDGVEKFLESASSIGASLSDFSGKLDGSLGKLEEILAAVDPQKVAGTVDNIDAFSSTLSEQRLQLAAVFTSVSQTATLINEFSKDLSSTMKKVDVVVTGIDSQRLNSAITNIDESSAKLSKVLDVVNRNTIGQTIDDLSATVRASRGIAEKIDGPAVSALVADLSAASKSASGILAQIDAAKLNNTITNIDNAAKQAEQTLAAVDSAKVGKAVDDISAAASGARAIVDGLDQNVVNSLIADIGAASKNVTTLVSAIDAARVNQLVSDISGAAESANKAAKDISGVTGIVGKNSSEIQKIISDASELTARLNESSKKIDSVITSADNLIGGGTADGLVVDIQNTLAEFRRTARTLNARVSELTGSVSQFTKRGLGDTQGLINDARQSIKRIDRVIRNIQNNPSSLITGGGGSRVRETRSARPRR